MKKWIAAVFLFVFLAGLSVHAAPASAEEYSQDFDESDVWYLKNVGSGMVLDVHGETFFSEREANVQIYSQGSRDNLSQQFILHRTEEGWYQILPLSNLSMAVNPFSNDPHDGTDVNIYPADPGDRTQGWYIRRGGPYGEYSEICSAWNPDLVLTADGPQERSNVYLSGRGKGNAQKWELVRVNSGGEDAQRYRLYGDLIRTTEENVGSLYAKSSANLPECLSLYGLCWAQLIDMDGDGAEELLLVTNSSVSYQEYIAEIWTADGGSLVKLFEDYVLVGGDAGSETLSLNFLDGKYVIMSGFDGGGVDYKVLRKSGRTMETVYQIAEDWQRGGYLVNGQAVNSFDFGLLGETAVRVRFLDYKKTVEFKRAEAQIEMTKAMISLRSGREEPAADLDRAAAYYGEVLDGMKTRWDEPRFALAFIDEDEYPELLVTGNGSILSTVVEVYSYRDGSGGKIGEAGGFGMVDFVPGRNCLHFTYQRLSYDNDIYWHLKGSALDYFSYTQFDSDNSENAWIDGVQMRTEQVKSYREAMSVAYPSFSRFYWGSVFPVNEENIRKLGQGMNEFIIR